MVCFTSYVNPAWLSFDARCGNLLKTEQRLSGAANLNRTSTPMKSPPTPTAAGRKSPGTNGTERSASPAGFQFKPTGSAFAKEYTYSVDDRTGRRAYSPSSYGFNYTGAMERDAGKISPITPSDDPSSPTSRKATAVAFTYKPPGAEIKSPADRRTSPLSPMSAAGTASPTLSKSGILSARMESPTLSKTAILAGSRTDSPSMRSTKYTESSLSESSSKVKKVTVEKAQKPTTLAVTPVTKPVIEPKKISPRGAFFQTQVKTPSPVTPTRPSPDTLRQKSAPAPLPKVELGSGRASRQSNLDESEDSSVSSDESSMVDEYEKEASIVETPAITATSRAPAPPRTTMPSPAARSPTTKLTTQPSLTPKQSPSPPSLPKQSPPALPKQSPPHISPTKSPHTPTRAEFFGYKRPSPETDPRQKSAPRYTHMSRKRVVTNADGSVEEMEEVMEPSSLSAISASKPVVVGVVPSLTKPELVL